MLIKTSPSDIINTPTISVKFNYSSKNTNEFIEANTVVTASEKTNAKPKLRSALSA
jgi:hypothetical protein